MARLATWRGAWACVPPGLALGAALWDAAQASARSAWASGTFMYADLCTLPGTGTPTDQRVMDQRVMGQRVMGQRVILRRSPNGDGLTYQGGAAEALPAGALNLDEATKAIIFVVATGAGPLRFEGVASADALTGTVVDAGGVHPVHLPRTLRSHAHEPCPDGTTHPVGLER